MKYTMSVKEKKDNGKAAFHAAPFFFFIFFLRFLKIMERRKTILQFWKEGLWNSVI